MAGRRLANYLAVLTLETQTVARACGKSHVHNLEPEDLVALTIEAAAMAKVPLAGTDWIPGAKDGRLRLNSLFVTQLEPGTTKGKGRGSWHHLVLTRKRRVKYFPRIVRRLVRHDARENSARDGDRYRLRKPERVSPALPCGST